MTVRRTLALGVVFTTALTLALPFVGGAGPSLSEPAVAAGGLPGAVVASSPIVAGVSQGDPDAAVAAVTNSPTSILLLAEPPRDHGPDTEHIAQKPVPKPVPVVTGVAAASGTNERRAALAAQGKSCPGNVGGSTGSAPSKTSPGGVAGTTTGDIASFAATFNAIRVANCLNPVPMRNFRYDSCMEKRLFWMAEDPSTDPMSAWGHTSTAKRSDGKPIEGCDGNLAGGSGNTGATVAQKWWNSTAHRNSLYRPSFTGGTGGVCIYLAMTHGGVPNEPYSFTRAAARWGGC